MEEKDLEKQVLSEINGEEEKAEDVAEEVKEDTEEAEVLDADIRKVKVKLNVDYRTLKYYNVYVLKHVRKFYLIYAIFMALLLGGAVYAIISKVYVVAALMGVFALYLLYQTLTIEKTIDRQLTAHFMRRRPLVQEYTFTDEGITVTPNDGGEPIVYEWVYVTHIYQIPQFYYLYLGKQPVIVDRNPDMIIEGTKEDLEGIIMEQASKKPFKKLEKDILKEPVEFNYPDYDAMEAAQEDAKAEAPQIEEQKEDAVEVEASVEEESSEEVAEEANEESSEVENEEAKEE